MASRAEAASDKFSAAGPGGDDLFARAHPFSCRYDLASQIVMVTAFGFWTEQDVDLHCQLLARTIEEARRVNPIVCALVDLREGVVQDQAVMSKLDKDLARNYRPKDRVALVLQSTLLKLQLKRSPVHFEIGYFDDPLAAKAWLRP